MESQTQSTTDDLRKRAVREYFRWHLGDQGWALAYEQVWADPVAALTRLAEEQGAFTDRAVSILASGGTS